MKGCGCCGSPIAKPNPRLESVNGWPTIVLYCEDHWVWCHHGPMGPNGEDWDDDSPEWEAEEAKRRAEWEALPWEYAT